MASDITQASSLARLKRIESSRVFQLAVIFIIIVSALAIGAKTYELPPLAEQSLLVLDKGVTLFFGHIDEALWGDVAISMLTLFRVATFEDWTDVMYATIAVYPLSSIYYLTFIFLTAFIFLNMMIGSVLEVMGEEKNALQTQQAHDERERMAQQLTSMQIQLDQLTALLKQHKPGA